MQIYFHANLTDYAIDRENLNIFKSLPTEKKIALRNLLK